MPSVSVFGAQWGDEGKGKIIDRMARDADFVVRYQGGANAGHTVIVGSEKYVLHQVPAGILHPGKTNVIGNGVAVDPVVLFQEIDGLVERGVAVTPDNLLVSGGAHVIFEYHKRIDAGAERYRGAGRIGTTGRGIGPCYADKAARTGIRIADLLAPEVLRRRLTASLAEKNAWLESVVQDGTFDVEATFECYAAIGERLTPFVKDAGAAVRAAGRQGKQILFEGAQGAMLDIDHGTYPYVTSSNTGISGVGSGAGFPPNRIDSVIGIAKAYCTRVGEGPFPTEEPGEIGQRIRDLGNEYGATTGRPRRCGWFDAVAVRYALDLNGADGWIVTNLDVLSPMPEVRVATAYRLDGRRLEEYPAHVDLSRIEVEYETFPGWSEDVTGVRSIEDLPVAARTYLDRLAEVVGVPIVMVSIGPERDQVAPWRAEGDAASGSAAATRALVRGRS